MLLEFGMAVITQGLHDISPQKTRFAFRPTMNRMTFVADERQAVVIARVMKCRLLVGIPTPRRMTFQTQPVSE